MGCCCGVVGTTRVIAILGILVSSAVIAPPAYIFFTGRDYSELLPFLKYLHRMLEEEYEKKGLTENTLTELRDLLNAVSENAGLAALVSSCAAGFNIFLDLLLLIGACCRIRCLLLPWLIFSMLEILVLGAPTVIFFSILGIYLYVQGLLIPSLVSFSAPCILVVISLFLWFFVLAAYSHIAKYRHCYDDDQGDQEVQPLMSNEAQGVASTSYNLGGHYPQYYPPHNQNAGPSAPPQTTPTDKNNPHLYPTLPA